MPAQQSVPTVKKDVGTKFQMKACELSASETDLPMARVRHGLPRVEQYSCPGLNIFYFQPKVLNWERQRFEGEWALPPIPE